MKSKNGVNSMTKPEKDILKMLQNFTLLMRVSGIASIKNQKQSPEVFSKRKCS